MLRRMLLTGKKGQSFFSNKWGFQTDFITYLTNYPVVKDKAMLIEVSDGVRIRIDKNAIFANSEDVQQQQK